MDPVTLSIVIAALVIALGALLWARSRQANEQQGAGGARRRVPPPQGDNAVQGARGRRAGPRMRRGQANVQQQEEEEEHQDQEMREELEEAGVKVPEGKIGKKKLEKLQQKADKKMAREAEERDREEMKKKKAEEEEMDAKRREREKEEEKREEEEEQRRREEKERKEHEEYLKLKAAFTLDEEGFDEEEGDGDEESKLKQFIDYIKATKVVLLEDLAAHFKLKTQEAIDRVNQLQEDGELTGVIDDRGKFIYISQEELEAVAKFIRQRGRVSIAELAESSNSLINLAPEAATS